MVGPQETLKPKIWKDVLKESELYRSGEGIFCLDDVELKQLKLNKKENELIKPLYVPEDLQKYYTNFLAFYFLPRNILADQT